MTTQGLGKTLILTGVMNQKKNPAILCASALAILCAGFWFYGCGKGASKAKPANGQNDSGASSTLKPRPAYVGRDSCVECHAAAVAKWEGSHHFHAMELPGNQTVRADFNGTTFTHHNITSRFSMKDGRFLVETENQNVGRCSHPLYYLHS